MMMECMLIHKYTEEIREGVGFPIWILSRFIGYMALLMLYLISFRQWCGFHSLSNSEDATFKTMSESILLLRVLLNPNDITL